MERDRLFVAIDGGGSKTEICVYDANSKTYHTDFFGSANFKVAGIDTVRENIIGGLHSMLNQHNMDLRNVSGLVLGISGCDSEDDLGIIQALISEMGIPNEKIHICNDSELIFHSVSDVPGICIIAGTGSIATGYGMNGEVQRSGGWGSPLSDEGSGGWIGSRVLQAYLRWYDGFGEPQPAFASVETQWETENIPLPVILSALNFSEIASIAKDVTEAAEQGDKFCLAIIDEAVMHLARITVSVYQKLHFSRQEFVTVVMGGSLFQNRYFSDKYRKTTIEHSEKENIRFLELDGDIAKNGIRLARKLFDH